MAIKPFKNEKYTDFSKADAKRKQILAIENLEEKLGQEYPLIIGGEEVYTNNKFNSINPSNPSQAVGIFQKGTADHAQHAMEVALAKFEDWRFVPAKKRADYLFRAAKIMRRRRFELNATMILEVGKTWPEADGDTAEAIDFLEFYAREMLRYADKQPVVQYKGEKDELVYIPLGVGVVVPPWNFPLAILTGMTSATLVTGNTVVLKPSSDSPLIAYKFMDVMQEAGLPPGVVNFVSGPGSAVGDTLVMHPKTRFISFTGSKEVGIHIYEEAAKVRPGQIWLKRVVAEMGGKDSIIIDDGVDLDNAAAGIISSAYGFQGQKCSACSRAIIHESVYDKLLEKLVTKANALTVGPAREQSNYMGPVINKGSMEKMLEYIQTGVKEGGRLVAGGEQAPGDGYFLRPTIIADVDPKATIAQEEIFGPVLAVIKAKDFDHAIEIANNTEFGLTGAVYSNSKRCLEKAKDFFHCGNLYLNRKCTGALVGVHPFGGFNMSGTDSKAGGRDYLLLFMQGKSIAEKKMK
jgi:1-pyrroline-5-carboxylate dehydrogenase